MAKASGDGEQQRCQNFRLFRQGLARVRGARAANTAVYASPIHCSRLRSTSDLFYRVYSVLAAIEGVSRAIAPHHSTPQYIEDGRLLSPLHLAIPAPAPLPLQTLLEALLHPARHPANPPDRHLVDRLPDLAIVHLTDRLR